MGHVCLLYDLREQRRRALERVQATIVEQELVLKAMSPDNPHRYLVVGILVRLRASEARLKSGLPVF